MGFGAWTEPDCGIPDNTAMHLLIPFACSDAPGCAAQLPTLHLPQLEALLQRMVLVDADLAPASSLSPPHERARARLLGLPPRDDGCLPWAAIDAQARGLGEPGEGWAWISPVHWDVGSQHIRMGDPRDLALDEAASRALMAAMAVYFAEDGLELHYAEPHRWLCRAGLFRSLPTASLERVVGRDLQTWMPAEPALRRLQNEMQMLLYTHPINDARAAQGRISVNSFWVSGSGAWPGGPSLPPPDAITTAHSLQDAALRGDWAAWARAWADTDAHACRKLLERLPREPDSRLVLCGERGALSFAPAQDSFWQQLRRRWAPTRLTTLQDRL